MSEELNQEVEVQEEEKKTYSQEEMDKLLESETDRRVTQALKTAQSKFEERLAKEIEKTRKEAEEDANLGAEERAKKQFKKDMEKFEEERAALEKEKLDIRTRKALRAEGLNEDFACFLKGVDEEESLENIATFKAALEEAIAQGVKDQLKGASPKVGLGQETMSKKDIMSIKDPIERQRKIAENINLFD